MTGDLGQRADDLEMWECRALLEVAREQISAQNSVGDPLTFLRTSKLRLEHGRTHFTVKSKIEVVGERRPTSTGEHRHVVGPGSRMVFVV